MPFSTQNTLEGSAATERLTALRDDMVPGDLSITCYGSNMDNVSFAANILEEHIENMEINHPKKPEMKKMSECGCAANDVFNLLSGW